MTAWKTASAESAAHGLERSLADAATRAVERHCRRQPLLLRAQLLRAPCRDSLIAGTSHYGLDFTTAIARDNLFAVQFHPEKSSTAGLTLLKNFLNWAP
jgi:hypothetical protein